MKALANEEAQQGYFRFPHSKLRKAFAQEPGSPYVSSFLRQPHGQTSSRGCGPFVFWFSPPLKAFWLAVASVGQAEKASRPLCKHCTVFTMNTNSCGHNLELPPRSTITVFCSSSSWCKISAVEKHRTSSLTRHHRLIFGSCTRKATRSSSLH